MNSVWNTGSNPGLVPSVFFTSEHHNKIARSIFALNEIKNILPIEIRRLVYNTLIKSHLEYGIIIWGSSRCEQLKKVKILQKKAVRNVSNKHLRAHCTPIFGKLELLKLEDLYRCFVFYA